MCLAASTTLPVWSAKGTENFSNIAQQRSPPLHTGTGKDIAEKTRLMGQEWRGGHSALFVWFAQIPFHFLGIPSIFLLWGIIPPSWSVFVWMEGDLLPPALEVSTCPRPSQWCVPFSWLHSDWISSGHVTCDGQSWDFDGNALRIGAFFCHWNYYADGDHGCPYKERGYSTMKSILPPPPTPDQKS